MVEQRKQLGIFSNKAVTYSFIICTLLLISMIEFSQYQVPIINLNIDLFNLLNNKIL